MTARNIRGRELLCRETPDETYYYLPDAHGDIIGLTDGMGNITKSYAYDPFGNQETPALQGFGLNSTITLWQNEVEKADNPFGYCGEYLDEESGLIYLRGRYYDPATARFTQEDPTQNGFNWYAYCNNNPINCWDPSGYDVGWASAGWIDPYTPSSSTNTSANGYSLREKVEKLGGTITPNCDKNGKVASATVVINGQTTVYTVGQGSCRIENGRIMVGGSYKNKSSSVKSKTATAGALYTADKVAEKATKNMKTTKTVVKTGGALGPGFRMEGEAIDYGKSAVKSGAKHLGAASAAYTAYTVGQEFVVYNWQEAAGRASLDVTGFVIGTGAAASLNKQFKSGVPSFVAGLAAAAITDASINLGKYLIWDK